MYSVGVNVYCCARRDIVATKTIGGNGLPYRHGNRRNVSQGFATYIVQIVEIVSIKFGKALYVIARCRIEEEGIVLLDFCSDTLLNLGMRCEQVNGPGDARCRC